MKRFLRRSVIAHTDNLAIAKAIAIGVVLGFAAKHTFVFALAFLVLFFVKLNFFALVLGTFLGLGLSYAFVGWQHQLGSFAVALLPSLPLLRWQRLESIGTYILIAPITISVFFLALFCLQRWRVPVREIIFSTALWRWLEYTAPSKTDKIPGHLIGIPLLVLIFVGYLATARTWLVKHFIETEGSRTFQTPILVETLKWEGLDRFTIEHLQFRNLDLKRVTFKLNLASFFSPRWDIKELRIEGVSYRPPANENKYSAVEENGRHRPLHVVSQENPLSGLVRLASDVDTTNEIKRRAKNLHTVEFISNASHWVDAFETKSKQELAKLSESAIPVNPSHSLQLNSRAETLNRWLVHRSSEYRELEQKLAEYDHVVAQDILETKQSLRIPELKEIDYSTALTAQFIFDLISPLLSGLEQNSLGTLLPFQIEQGTIQSMAEAGSDTIPVVVEFRTNPLALNGKWSGPDNIGHAQITLEKNNVFWELKDWPILNQVFTNNLSLSLKTSGKVNATFNLTLQDHEFKGRWDGEITDLKFKTESRYKVIHDTFHNVFETSSKTPFRVAVSGPVDSVQVAVESELGKNLATAVQREFKHHVGAIDDDLKKHILDITYPEKNKIINRLQWILAKSQEPVAKELESIQVTTRSTDKSFARTYAARYPAKVAQQKKPKIKTREK